MKILAMAGGVGGAKLCLGLARALDPQDLQIIVNTGDDEEFYGLHVSPDLDTVTYTLAGVANPETGWGIAGETFAALESLRRLGMDAWFGLGDRDFATHIVRTQMLRNGETLSAAADHIRRALGVAHPIAPMSDDRVRTVVVSENGDLPFQTYFVKMRCEPVARGLRFEGAEDASMSPAFRDALDSAGAIVICPSNPYLSVAPMLAVPGVRAAVERFRGPRIAVSPIVGGEAIRGPAAKLLRELGADASCVGVARQYAGLCDIFVIDEVDARLAGDVRALGMEALVAQTVMRGEGDKIRLAREVLDAVGGS